MTKPPCKINGVDCPRRRVGCQSECEEYRKWEAVHAQERAAQRLYYAGANDANAHMAETITRADRRYQRKRRVGQP